MSAVKEEGGGGVAGKAWLQLLLAAKCGMKFKAAIKFGKDNLKCMRDMKPENCAERLREILRKAHSLGIVMRLCVKQIINQ